MDSDLPSARAYFLLQLAIILIFPTDLWHNSIGPRIFGGCIDLLLCSRVVICVWESCHYRRFGFNTYSCFSCLFSDLPLLWQRAVKFVRPAIWLTPLFHAVYKQPGISCTVAHSSSRLGVKRFFYASNVARGCFIKLFVKLRKTLRTSCI